MKGVQGTKLLACFALLCGALAGASSTPERQVAEWVIRQGGQVKINGRRQVIDELAKLPVKSFRLTAIDLIGTTIDPKIYRDLPA